jgi:hypothetical protein
MNVFSKQHIRYQTGIFSQYGGKIVGGACPKFFQGQVGEKDWKKEYPDADEQFSDIPSYLYNLKTDSVQYFGEMSFVNLAAQAGQLAYTSGRDTIDRLDPTTGETTTVHVGRMGLSGIIISPNGELAIAHFTLSHPLGYLGNPTIIDLSNPDRRHFIDGFNYRLDWTTDLIEPTGKQKAH